MLMMKIDYDTFLSAFLRWLTILQFKDIIFPFSSREAAWNYSSSGRFYVKSKHKLWKNNFNDNKAITNAEKSLHSVGSSTINLWFPANI